MKSVAAIDHEIEVVQRIADKESSKTIREALRDKIEQLTV